MEFLHLNEPIPLVHKKKKYASFKITPIDDIIKWRGMQMAREKSLSLRLIDRDNRLMRYETEMDVELDKSSVQQEAWNDKVSRALNEKREVAARMKKAIEHQAWEAPPPPPEKTLFERFIHWLSCWGF